MKYHVIVGIDVYVEAEDIWDAEAKALDEVQTGGQITKCYVIDVDTEE